MSAPKPQARPRIAPPAVKSPLKRVASSPRTFGKAKPPAKITSCIHTLKGGVWCNDCAHTFRTQARETYARALRESKNGEVIRAAKEMLVRAVNEYALTPAGMTELEKDYAQLVSSQRRVEAADLRTKMDSLRKEVSNRNMQSRKNEQIRKAKMTTAISHSKTQEKKYIPAPHSADKTWTTSGCTYTFTNHMKERMDLRVISEMDVASAFNDFSVVKPMGQGKWSIEGKNGVTLCGFFEEVSSGILRFVITTVFRPGIAENNEG